MLSMRAVLNFSLHKLLLKKIQVFLELCVVVTESAFSLRKAFCSPTAIFHR